MMAARCEILLSPGTVISASTRGARLMRSSIRAVFSTNPCAGCACVRFSESNMAQPYPAGSPSRARILRHEKNLSRVRILDLRSRGEPFDVNIFAWGKGTLNQMRLARNRNAIWKISFRHLAAGGRRWCRRSGSFLSRGIFRRGRVRVKRLLGGQCRLATFGRIPCHGMSNSSWLLVIIVSAC